MNNLRVAWLLAAVVCCGSLSAQDRAMEIRKKIETCDRSQVLVVAHRGDWRYAPENSIEGIRHAIKLGADVVEVDVRQTKDGVLVLMHDETIDRTTSGKGKVSELTYDSISKVYLRSGCGIKTRERVPTLEEALVVIKGQVLINLDKADKIFSNIYPLLVKTATTKQVIMKSAKPVQLALDLYESYMDEVLYMPVVHLDKSDARSIIEGYETQLAPVMYELVYSDPNNPLPRELAQTIGKRALLWYNTLAENLCGGRDDDRAVKDPQGAYGYLIQELGANVLQTDRPEFALNYLRDKKLHN